MLETIDSQIFMTFLKEELDSDADFLAKLVHQHLNDLGELNRLLFGKSPNWQNVRAKAHSIYPTSGLLGATQLSFALKDLERLIGAGDLEKAKLVSVDISNAIPKVVSTLSQELGKFKLSA